MHIRRTNHITLSVSDLERSVRFYRDVLGLRVVARLPTTKLGPMAFLCSPHDTTNHHDLGLIANATAAPIERGAPLPPGLFHVAFEVGTIDELEQMQRRLEEANALGDCRDHGMHLSVYGQDPDGIVVELIWRAPNEDWSYDDEVIRHPLDFGAARQRWGGQRTTGSAAGIPA